MKVCRVCGSTAGFDDMLTVAEAAEIIGVSRQAVGDMIKREELAGATRETSGVGSPGGRPRRLIPLASVEAVAKARHRKAS